MIKYFKELKVNQIGVIEGINKNLYTWRNLISPYAITFPEFSIEGEEVYVDPYYGYSYNRDIIENDSIIYGESSLVFERMGEVCETERTDWLRIPFFKVPRIEVHSATQLFDCLMGMKLYSNKILFRGQPSEYFLNRPKELMSKLYGDQNAKEPSLLSYAVRKNKNFNEYYMEWSALIRAYLPIIWGREMATLFLEKIDGLNFYLLCLAIAQHYGLPTYGLDVSKKIDTALFFSLHKFNSVDKTNRVFKYTRKTKGSSVIYAFKFEQGETWDYQRFSEIMAPEDWLAFPRPLVQSASFAHTGWGYASNACAKEIIAAIVFNVEKIDFNELNELLLRNGSERILDEKNFFPDNDPFIFFLKKYIENYYKQTYNTKFKEFLKEYIYQI